MKLLSIITLIVSHFCIAQDTNTVVQWERIGEFAINQESAWMVDALQNVYITEKEKIKKIDKDGRLMFVQSHKAMGRINSIQALTPLKIIVFSEEQQTFCFLDNSLSLTEDCVELSDFDLSYINHIAVSSQSDKLWVFDQENSTLRLLELQGKLQGQDIKNMSGLLDIAEVRSIREMSNKLYVLDERNGLYIFDLYGSLIDRNADTEILAVQDIGTHSIYLKTGKLIVKDNNSEVVKEFRLPEEKVEDFIISGSRIYLKTVNKLSIFKLEF